MAVRNRRPRRKQEQINLRLIDDTNDRQIAASVLKEATDLNNGEDLDDLAELEELDRLSELEELAELAELEERAELAEFEAGDQPSDDALDEEYDGDFIDAPVPVLPAAESDSEEKVVVMAHAADSVRAEDITVLDLRQLTIIADFFLICTGKSSIQIRAIADRIEERMRDIGYRKLRVEGYQEATWLLLDYGDVVCHVMAAEQRAFYDLETFWGSAPRLALDLKPEATTISAARSHFESLSPIEDD